MTRLVDFQISPDRGVTREQDINPWCSILNEAFRYEISYEKIEAPCQKIVIRLDNEEDERIVGTKFTPRLLYSILEVGVLVRESILLSPDEARFRNYVLDAVESGLDEIRAVFNWPGDAVRRIAGKLRTREPLVHYHLPAFSKLDRKTGSSFDVYYDMTEKETTLKVIVTDRGGLPLCEREVVRRDGPLSLDFFFHVKSTILKDGTLIFRDKSRQTLAEVRCD